MLRFNIILTFVLSIFLSSSLKADDLRKEFQKYINEIITEVKAAESPEEKREKLNILFSGLINSFDKVKEYPLVPEEDYEGLDILKEKITERYNELNGLDGFEKVPDNRLNEFASFSLQDIEQAEPVLIISLTTLLLLIILAILIF